MQWSYQASCGYWQKINDKVFVLSVSNIILKHEIWFFSCKSVSLAIIHICSINEFKTFQNTTIVKHFITVCFLPQKKSFLHQKVFCLKLLWKSLSCLDHYKISFSLLKDISWQLFMEHSWAAQFMCHNKLTNY